MLVSYGLNSFLVWISCILNGTCKVHKFLATCFDLFTCQFGPDAFALWGFGSELCHLAYNSSFCVPRGGVIFGRADVCRKRWECYFKRESMSHRYERKLVAHNLRNCDNVAYINNSVQPHVIQQLGLVGPRTRSSKCKKICVFWSLVVNLIVNHRSSHLSFPWRQMFNSSDNPTHCCLSWN